MYAQTKYMSAMPVMSKVSSAIKEMVHMGSHGRYHGVSTRERGGCNTSGEKQVIEGKMINPFKTTNQTDLQYNYRGQRRFHGGDYVHEKGIAALITAVAASTESFHLINSQN